jgi:radical SAM protein with 4Fe4S-binding SPASM domain
MPEQTTLIGLVAKATLAHRPPFASIELTYQCNLACRFCYNPVERRGQVRSHPLPKPGAPPLAFEEIVSLLDQLRDMNVLFLTLTGGEPLVHPRFWDIAEAAKARGFALRIFTNGVLIDEAVADRLAALRPFCLEISVHGATAATSEALNQVPGSHARMMHALELLRERDLLVYLKCVVTRLVENELEDIQRLGEGFGYSIYFDPHLYTSTDGETYPLDLRASDEALYRLFSAKGLNIGGSPFEGTPDLNCSVASGSLHIDPYGNLHPCIQWDEPVGNIRTAPLREIWERSPRLGEIRELNRRLPQLLKDACQDASFCNFCPAASRRELGSPTAMTEQHLRVARIRRSAFEDAAGPS